MRRNMRKVIALLLFVFMSLTMFASANPAGDIKGVLEQDPTITLDENNKYSIEVFDDVPEFKATAKDANGTEFKVDITTDINNEVVGQYTVKFRVEDTNGNDAELTREFLVQDTTNPVITLIGGGTIRILHGRETYTDQGATVTDNYDPTRTINGTIAGDPFAVGNYYLVYNAQDANGNNAAQVTRTIRVLAPGADEDGDGYTNVEEFEAGTDINDPESNPNLSWIVTFDSDGGSTVENAVVKNNEKVEKPENPTKTGYEFVTWNLDDQPFDFETLVKQNYNLKAIWKASDNVSYKVEHSYENIDNDEFVINESETETLTGTTNDLTKAVAKTVSGFTAKEITQVNINADGSTVVTVLYNRNSYKVTYKVTGTVEANDAYNVTENVKFGTTLTELATPTKVGYAFNGWTGFVPTMPNNDLEITGFYAIDETAKEFNYIINYYLDGTTDEVPGITTPFSGKGYINEVVNLTHPTTDQGYKVKDSTPSTITVLEDNSAVLTVLYVKDQEQWINVEFITDGNGTLEGNTKFEVLKAYALNATKQVNKVALPTPKPNAGYEFDKWDVELDQNAILSVDTTFKALFKDNTAPVIENVKVIKEFTNENSITVTGRVFDENLKNYNLRIVDENKKLVSPWKGLTVNENKDGELGVFDISDLADGNYFVRIWAEDTSGNKTGINTHIYVPFVIDRTKPIVKINLNRERYINSGDVVNKNQNPEIEASDENLLEFGIYDEDEKRIAGPTDLNVTTRRVKIDWLKEGTYTVIAKDKAGNESDPFKVTIDNTKPVMEVLTPEENKVLKATDVKVKVKVTDNVGLKKVTINLYKEGTLLKSFSKTLTGEKEFTYEHDLTGLNLEDGTYYVKANALDMAGTISNTVVRTFIVDNTKPIVKINLNRTTYINSGDTVLPNQKPEVEARDENLLEFSIYDKDNNFVSSAQANGAKHRFANISHLADGKYTVIARDLAGNKSDPFFVIIYRDNVNPIITVKPEKEFTTGSIADDIYSKVSFKLFDNFSVDYVELNGVKKDLSNNKWSDLNYVTPGVFGAVEGENELVLYDLAGNTATYKFILDTTAPIIENVEVIKEITNENKITVTGKVFDENLKNYNLRIVDENKKLVSPWKGLTVNENKDGELGVFDISDLTDGNYFVRIWAEDTSGNKTGINTHIYFPFVIDRTKPIVKINLNRERYINSGDVVNKNQNPEIEASDANLLEFGIYQDGKRIAGPTDLNVTTRRAKIDWLKEGKYTVVAKDKAGNKSYPFEVTIDNTKPVMEVLTPTEGAVIKATDVKINVKVTDNVGLKKVTINLYKEGTLLKSFSKTLTGEQEFTYEHDLTALNLEDGTYYVKANALDMAGTISNTVVRTFIVDNTKPTVKINLNRERYINSGDTVLPNQKPEVEARDENLLEFSIYDKDNNFVSSAQANGAKHRFANISHLADGKYTVIARDLAGNKSDPFFVIIYRDNVNPIITVKPEKEFTTGSIADDIYSKVSFKLFDNFSVDYVELNGVKKDLSNNKWSDLNYVTPGVFGAVEGENELVLYDLAGNTATYKFILDTTAPMVKNISIDPYINNNTGGAKVTVYFDLIDGSGIDLTKSYVMFADGPNTAKQLKESEKLNPVLISDNSYKVEFNSRLFVLDNYVGKYNLQFTVVDSIGNRTSFKPAEFRQILVDNSGPEGTLDSPTSGSLINGTVRFKFKVTDHTGVKSGYMKLREIDKTYNLTHESGDIWYVDIDTGTIASGEYTIDVRFVDVFGNPRSSKNKGTVKIDNNENAWSSGTSNSKRTKTMTVRFKVTDDVAVDTSGNITVWTTPDMHFKKPGVTYTVEHHYENIEDDPYSINDLETEKITGEVGEQTNATAKDVIGFTAQDIEQKTITADGNTVVEVLYDRKTYGINIDTNSVEGIESVEGAGTYKYEASVTMKVNLKPGYTMNNWITANNGLIIDSCAGNTTCTVTVSDNATYYVSTNLESTDTDVLNKRGIFTLDYMHDKSPFYKTELKEQMSSSKFDGFNIVDGTKYKFSETEKLYVYVQDKNIDYKFLNATGTNIGSGALTPGNNTLEVPKNTNKLNFTFPAWGQVGIESFVIESISKGK